MAGYIFGNHQGLAVYAGHVYAAWSGDESGGTNESMRLNILIAPMVIAAGPRVVSSTMGVATPLTIPVTTPGGPTMINTRDPVTGIPQFDGFFVTFDRYVNPATFTASEIVISYLAPGASSTVEYGTGPNMIPLTNLQIIPQDAPSSPVGVKSFLVTFSPLEGVGTYSYAIGPGVSDRIRTATATGVLISSGNEMDQNADGQPGELTLDQYAAPRPLNGTPFQSPYDPTTLPIIVPGPSIISTAALDANGNPIPQQTDGENLALDTDGHRRPGDLRPRHAGRQLHSQRHPLAGRPDRPGCRPVHDPGGAGVASCLQHLLRDPPDAQRLVCRDDQSEHLFGGQQRPDPDDRRPG